MVVPGQLLLVYWMRVCSVVGAVVLVQHDAFLVPAVCDGGDNRANARPAGGKAEEGGAAGEASGGVRARDCDGRAGALGGA